MAQQLVALIQQRGQLTGFSDMDGMVGSLAGFLTTLFRDGWQHAAFPGDHQKEGKARYIP
jgi:hypothetical protein